MRTPTLGRHARNAQQSAHPELWDGLVCAYSTDVGFQGDILFDLSPQNRNGSLINTLPSDWVRDENGLSVDFSGSAYCSLGLFTTLTKWSIVSKFTPNDLTFGDWTTGKTILTNDRSGWNNDVLFGITPEGSLFTPKRIALVHQDATNTSRTNIEDTVDAVIGQSYIVVVTSDGNELNLYVDGVLKSTAPRTGAALTFNGAQAYIGRSVAPGFNNREFGGLIQAIYLYGFVLPTGRISTLMRDPLAPFRLRPTYFGMTSGGGPNIKNSSGLMVSVGDLSGIGGLFSGGFIQSSADSDISGVGAASLGGQIQVSSDSDSPSIPSKIMNALSSILTDSVTTGIPSSILGGSGSIEADSLSPAIPSILLSGSASMTAEAIISGVGSFDIVLISGAGLIEVISTVSGAGNLLLGGKSSVVIESDLSGVVSAILGGHATIQSVSVIEGEAGLFLAGSGVMDAVSEIAASGGINISEVLNIISIRAKFTQAKPMTARFARTKNIITKF